MFGGLAFLVGGHMVVAASREAGVLVSVDRSDTDTLLQKPHTRPMVMRGREMVGWLRVDPDGLRTKRQLAPWVKRGVDHARARFRRSRGEAVSSSRAIRRFGAIVRNASSMMPAISPQSTRSSP